MQLRSLKMTPQVFLQKSTTDVLNGKKGQFEQRVLREILWLLLEKKVLGFHTQRNTHCQQAHINILGRVQNTLTSIIHACMHVCMQPIAPAELEERVLLAAACMQCYSKG
jgi:hypothetical protein